MFFTDDGPVSCDFGSFACDNGQCISESLLCDGTPHCEDGSDEWQQLCGKIYNSYPRLFKNRVSRKRYNACEHPSHELSGNRCIFNMNMKINQSDHNH